MADYARDDRVWTPNPRAGCAPVPGVVVGVNGDDDLVVMTRDDLLVIHQDLVWDRSL
jgi:hypothetical protein